MLPLKNATLPISFENEPIDFTLSETKGEEYNEEQANIYSILERFWSLLNITDSIHKNLSFDNWEIFEYKIHDQEKNKHENDLKNYKNVDFSITFLNSIYKEFGNDELNKLLIAEKLLSESKHFNKNYVFYTVIEKAIFNDWYEFSKSLFPNMRDMTKKEQELWNELEDDISEIVKI